MTTTADQKRLAKDRAAAALADQFERLQRLQNDLSAAILKAEQFATLRDELRDTVDELTALGFSRGDAIAQLGLPSDLARVVRSRRPSAAAGKEVPDSTSEQESPNDDMGDSL